MSRGSKLSRFFKAPMRALGRARDFYVKSLNGCASFVPAEAAFSYPAFATLPRSYSHSSYSAGSVAEEDLRELIRAASQKRAAATPAVARSQSLAMGRIDEDGPCEFSDSYCQVGSGARFSRSWSLAASGAGNGRAGRNKRVAAFS